MNKWTDDNLKTELSLIMKDYSLDEIPTRSFLESVDRVDLASAISRKGGFIRFADRVGLPRRKAVSKWSLSKIEGELLKYISDNDLKRMPSKPEMIKNGRNDLGCAMTRYKGMRWWADKVGLPMKETETNKGNAYERLTKKILSLKGHDVKEMTTKYPYDLLVNGNVKIDVKVSSPGDIRGSRVHTFRPSKEYPTCDLYICFALDEEGKEERVLVIPSKFAQVTTICIGADSKYNAFIDRWDYVQRYTEFYESLKMV
jgi:hypothetical protein